MDELKARDVLDIIRRVAIFYGGPIADDLDAIEQLLTGLFKSCRLISADLEHALIFCPDSPLRKDVDNLDAWLDAVHAPADIEAEAAPDHHREQVGEVDEAMVERAAMAMCTVRRPHPNPAANPAAYWHWLHEEEREKYRNYATAALAAALGRANG